MALSNQTDPAHAERVLGTWLAEKLGRDVSVTGVEIPSAAGLSAETILFSADGRELVARVRPAGAAVFPDYDFEAEFRVLEAVGRSGVPVPEVLWYEPDASLLGGEFFVMERLYGRVPADDPPFTATGWGLGLTAEEQATLCENALRVLADIHRTPTEGLDFLRRGLDEEIAHWEETFSW